MIDKFSYFTEDGISLNLNLGIKVDQFKGNEESSVISFYKGQGKGVKWFYKNDWVYIFESNKKLSGYPTADREKAIIIYPIDHEVYIAPCNAIIYNADGSKYMQLIAPEPISDLAKTKSKNSSKKKEFNSPLRLYFEGVSWADYKDEIVTVVKIGFDRDWWEERVFNHTTGQFGECLSSGRR